MDDDTLLLRGLKNKNKNIFDAIFIKYYSPLCSWAYKYIEDHSTVEDIVQDVFVKLWSDMESIRIKTSLRAFLITAVRNKCIDFIRTEKIKDKYISYSLQDLNSLISETDFLITEFELNEIINQAMNKMPVLFSLLITIIFIHVLLGGSVRGTAQIPIQTISWSSIGFPAGNQCEQAAWKVNELKLFDGKLFVGHGDYGVNTGPTDILYYDFEREAFVKEFTIDDEAIVRFRIIDDMLTVPGVDSTESWDFGNVYIRTEEGWVKKRTV